MTDPWLGHLNGCSVQWSSVCDCDPDAPVEFCPRCHEAAGRPHTEYCPVSMAQRYDADPRYRRADGYTHAQALKHCICVTSGPDAYGPDEDCPMHGVNPTIRPDDDPAPTPTCDGRNCGGRPHE